MGLTLEMISGRSGASEVTDSGSQFCYSPLCRPRLASDHERPRPCAVEPTAADGRGYNRVVNARRWLAVGVLVVFTLLPALQLQCEIACAGDDASSTSAAGDARDDAATLTPSLAAPDDCVGHAAPSAMLPGTVQRPAFIALIVHVLPALLQSGPQAVAPPPFDHARSRGSACIGIPLRI